MPSLLKWGSNSPTVVPSLLIKMSLLERFTASCSRNNIVLILAALALLSGCEQELNEEDAFKLANFYLEQNNEKLAVQVLMQELEKSPEDPDVYQALGTIFVEADYFDDAIYLFNRARSLGCGQVCAEGLVDAYLGMGQIASARREHEANIPDKNTEKSKLHAILIDFFERGNFEQTSDWLKASQSPDADEKILILLLRQGLYDEIVSKYQAEAGYSEQELLVFAGAYHQLERYQDAEAVLAKFEYTNEFRLLNRRIIQAAELRVKNLIALDRLDQADEFYKGFLEANKESPYAVLQSAKELIDRSEFDEAISLIDAIYKRDAGNAAVAQLLAVAHIGKGDFNAVVDILEVFKPVLNSKMQLVLADAYNKTGRPDKAIEMFDRLSANDQQRVLLARSYLLENDRKKALSTIHPVVRHETNVAYNLTLAELWFDLGEYRRVISSFATAPDQPLGMKYMVVKSYLRLDRVADARDYINRQQDLQHSLEMMGFLEASTGDIDTASKFYEELAEKKPDKRNAFLAASSQLKSGNQQKALDEIKAGMELEGDSRLLLLLASRMLRGSQHEETYRWLDSIPSEHSEYRSVQLVLADFEIANGSDDSAIRRLTPLMENPDSQILFLMARAYRLSDPDESIKLLEASLQQEFSSGIARQLYRHHLGKGDLDAVARINALIAQNSGVNSSTAPLLATGYLALDDYKKVEQLIETLHARGDTAVAKEIDGNLQAKQGKFMEAANIYRDLLGTETLPASSVEPILLKYYSARLRVDTENIENVLAEAEDALVQAPDYHDLRNLVATTYIGRNDTNAIKHYRILVDQFPDNVVFLNNLAWLSLDVNPADALQFSEKAYLANSDNVDVVDTYVQALLRNDQAEKAENLLQTKLEQDPDNDSYKKLLNSLN